METKAEELRVLYVALTRAREKLILVGSISKLAKKIAQWCQTAEHTKLTARGLGGRWEELSRLVMPGSALSWGRDCTAPVWRRGIGTFPLFTEDLSKWQVDIYRPSQLIDVASDAKELAPLLETIRELEPIADGEDFEWVDKTLGWQYKYAHILGVSQLSCQ